jgi:hypothetical protein
VLEEATEKVKYNEIAASGEGIEAIERRRQIPIQKMEG